MAGEKKKEKEIKDKKPAAEPDPLKKIHKERPWDHFRKTNSYKKMKGFAGQHMNRRTGGKGG